MADGERMADDKQQVQMKWSTWTTRTAETGDPPPTVWVVVTLFGLLGADDKPHARDVRSKVDRAFDELELQRCDRRTTALAEHFRLREG